MKLPYFLKTPCNNIYHLWWFFINKAFPDIPKKKPTISPRPAPNEATKATKIAGYNNPPATTETIAGAGRKSVALPKRLIKNIPNKPSDLKSDNLSLNKKATPNKIRDTAKPKK